MHFNAVWLCCDRGCYNRFYTFTPRVRAPTLFVNETGSGGAYTSIQDAINFSSDGDTVFVYSGIYYENVLVDKTINLTGEDRINTIINGSGIGDVVKVISNSVNISGFTLLNSGSDFWDAGIELFEVQNCQIYQLNVSHNICGAFLDSSHGNKIFEIDAYRNNWYGIFLLYSDDNNVIQNRIYSNTKDGIFIAGLYNNIIENLIIYNDNGILLQDSNQNNIIYNNINNNTRKGIDIGNSYYNNLFHNKVTDNFEGIRVSGSNSNNIMENNVKNNLNGIYIYWFSNFNNVINNNVTNSVTGLILEAVSNNNNITYNKIFMNMYGIYLKQFSNYNKIIYNNISLNDLDGIHFKVSCNNNSISSNYLESNSDYGIYLDNSTNNSIYHNYLIFNSNQAYDNTNKGNQWDNGYPLGGNYWSDYTDFDDFSGPDQDILGSDGIWDHNYSIDSDSIDRYPKVYPYPINPISLYPGWNLISIPFIQFYTDLGIVLDPIAGSYSAVQYYNATDSSDSWKHNCSSRPSHLNDLENINHNMGFWVYITDLGGIEFQYYGTQPTSNQTILLIPGWNMVGYPSLTSYNRTEGLNNLTFDDQVDAVWSYDAITQKWEEMGESDYFQIGKGYYIHAKSECEWEVPL
jgi:parallel beta-helix repeat protein